ncbi:MAG: aminopeptidase P family protein [Rhizobiales bacterium]|nr:aminopeptidase P family protein [Hyphomicrobiales bacterium]
MSNASQTVDYSARLAALRKWLRINKLAGFIVPRQDEFQGEYVAAYAERLLWLTGFSGSWGVAVAGLRKAAIFVDGRYTIQVRQQVNVKLFEPLHLVDEPPAMWIGKNLKKGERLGFDPWLVTVDQAKRYAEACEKAGAKLVPVARNPIDILWDEQPARPTSKFSSQPTQFAGRSAREKRVDMTKTMAKANVDAIVLTQPDSVAWVFNIRGHDVPYTPVALAYAILHRGAKAELFAGKARLPEDVAAQLKAVAIIKPPESISDSLRALGKRKAKVQIDPVWAPDFIRAKLAAAGARISNATDPCTFPKAAKNQVEREGARAAHRRDGAAMCRFLCWLENASFGPGLNEFAVAEKLGEFREASGELLDLSFGAIAGAGPNAAIPHYHVTRKSSLALEKDGIFLIDSGGQYQDGTTDITRTVVMGEPTPEMKDRFTRVLKGMIGVSLIRFPKGTCGSQIDVLARAALWKAGLDYDHGTGHGVGSYLSVHEGPARINKIDRTALAPGMILSNEPGFYKAGHYGIRIENLLLVTEAEDIKGGERPMHGFETLTLCPIDRRLIDTRLLTREELHWLDAYHARVLDEIGLLLSGQDLEWLKRACGAM